MRNALLVRENKKENWKKQHDGLTKPMSVAERKRRQRIKSKAKRMLLDLVLIEHAGIMGESSSFEEGLSQIAFFSILYQTVPDPEGTNPLKGYLPEILEK